MRLLKGLRSANHIPFRKRKNIDFSCFCGYVNFGLQYAQMVCVLLLVLLFMVRLCNHLSIRTFYVVVGWCGSPFYVCCCRFCWSHRFNMVSIGYGFAMLWHTSIPHFIDYYSNYTRRTFGAFILLIQCGVIALVNRHLRLIRPLPYRQRMYIVADESSINSISISMCCSTPMIDFFIIF